MQLNLDQWLEKQDALIEEQVDEILSIEQSATFSPTRKVVRNKGGRREKIKESLTDKALESDLKDAVKIIYLRMPNVTKTEDWDRVDTELSNVRTSTENFFNENGSLDIDPSVSCREIYGFSKKTLINIYEFALTLFDTNEYNKAVKICTLLTTVAAEIPSFWLALGRGFQFSGQYEKALSIYSQAKKRHPNTAKLYLFSAECYDALCSDTELSNELDQLKKLSDKNSSYKKLWEEAKDKFEGVYFFKEE